MRSSPAGAGLATLLTVAALSGCTISVDQEPTVLGPAPDTQAVAAPAPPALPVPDIGPPPDAPRVPVVLVTRDGRLVVSTRPADPGRPIDGLAAIHALLGPRTDAEMELGLTSHIPTDTSLIEWPSPTDRFRVHVGLSPEFAAAGTAEAFEHRLSQVACTLALSTDAREVFITVNGRTRSILTADRCPKG